MDALDGRYLDGVLCIGNAMYVDHRRCPPRTNSWKWTMFMISYMTILAYAAAFVTYQGGKLLGFS